MKNLERELADVEIMFTESSNVSDLLLSCYQDKKKKLENEYDYITDGILLRSKPSWYEQGREIYQVFFSLEKRNKAKSHVRRNIFEGYK